MKRSDQDEPARSLLEEIPLIIRSAGALFGVGDLQQLTDADHAQELSRNSQLRASPREAQEKRRGEYRGVLMSRLRLLRSRLLTSFVAMASAVVAGATYASVTESLSEGAHAALAIASLFCFAWATLGRLGWAGQSWKGDTVVERLDSYIFWVLYWIGTAVGTLAIL
jgi:hypothetical protein